MRALLSIIPILALAFGCGAADDPPNIGAVSSPLLLARTDGGAVTNNYIASFVQVDSAKIVVGGGDGDRPSGPSNTPHTDGGK
jgi:hypothetical protein